MKDIFDIMPKCEICGKKEATHFSSVKTNEYFHNDWKFTCRSCERSNFEYQIPISEFFSSSKSTLHWLDHLYIRNGMDWESFMTMIHRFHQRTQGDDGSLEARLKSNVR